MDSSDEVFGKNLLLIFLTMRVLVTGGMGFIGSHTVVELLTQGKEVIILDNLSNSKLSVLDAIEKISGVLPVFYQGAVQDELLVEKIFSEHAIECVIHFAAKKAVGESCTDPRLYYQENIDGLISLTKVMEKHHCRKIVFSSSCTVYDPEATKAPFDETASTGNNFSPYGTTKSVNEMILRDLALHKGWSAVCLRYFNPIGAHSSGLIGEDPAQAPTNLLPVIFDVLRKKRPYLEIFGNQYVTPDGTCLRDYIHVVDLALAHLHALAFLHTQLGGVHEYINIGTGKPTSVKELLAIVQKVTTKSVDARVVAPRTGDIPIAYASVQKAKQLLGREATYSVEDAVSDTWNFVQKHAIS